MAQEVRSQVFLLGVSGASGATGATGALGYTNVQSITFLTGEAFKSVSFQVSSQGQSVANVSAVAMEGSATLAAKNAIATGIDGVMYADINPRGPNQPNSNWARAQAGLFAPGPPMTLTVTNNGPQPVTVFAMITAETFLFT